MPNSPRLRFLDRSLLGCGFLLSGGLLPAYGQRGTEISLSVGPSLARPRLERRGLPDSFGMVAGFNAGTALRLTVPVRPWLGLGVEERITGLSQQFVYRRGSSRLSAGLGNRTLYQYGLRAVLYDVWMPGLRWGLDLALSATYALSAVNAASYSGRLWHDALTTQPTAAQPLIRTEATRFAALPMAGLEAQIRYEVGSRQALLLTAAYHRGLQAADVIRSTQADYLDAAGQVQQGSFVVSTRASYATLQLGYSLRLGSVAEGRTYLRSPPRRTPRYGAPAEDDETTDQLPDD